MSKSERVLDALMSGKQLTVKQIRSRYGVANPTALVNSLRKSGGFAIYSNTRTNKSGKTRNFYRMGTPSRAVIAAGYRALGTRVAA
jgi:hypothetical protein